MTDLFMERLATFSGPNKEFRLTLTRWWDRKLPTLVVCMLNPSVGDHERDDPTILALIWFAKLWGYGGLHIINLYSFRASQPKVMWAAETRIGPGNPQAIEMAFELAKSNCGRILAAWGNGGNLEGQADWFCGRARYHGVELICLGKTKSFEPKHPMARGQHRIPRDQQPIVYRTAA